MIGDTGSGEDVEHSRRLLDEVLAARPALRRRYVLDAGAGVGRVTKHVLLRRFDKACMLEPCSRWLKEARRYLGHRRADRCTLVNQGLEEYAMPRGTYDLVWFQWCLQYLTDGAVVTALEGAGQALAPGGVVMVKENRSWQRGKELQFQVDTPEGPNERYDITRPDDHHRWLFHCAGLVVDHWEHWDETTTWVLRSAGRVPDVPPGARPPPARAAKPVPVAAATQREPVVRSRK